MKTALKRYAILILVGLFVAGGASYLSFWRPQGKRQIKAVPVTTVEVEQVGTHLWSVPRDAVSPRSKQPDAYVLRVEYLRTERVPIHVTGEADSNLLLTSEQLKPGDLLVLQPEMLRSGQVVVPIAGVDDERLLRLTLEAGMAAVMSEDVNESVRFISAYYRDDLGFNLHFMRKLLRRAYKEFDQPQLDLVQPPAIQIEGKRALVWAQLSVTAVYRGLRGFLLGDQNGPNHILLVLERTENGWQLLRTEGLRPLGFEERSLRLLGARLGMPLTPEEQIEEQRFCMPCRQRMAERFG